MHTMQATKFFLVLAALVFTVACTGYEAAAPPPGGKADDVGARGGAGTHLVMPLPAAGELGGEIREVLPEQRDEMREQCTAECDGEWGRHGGMTYEWCLCRTEDAFAECNTGSECSGQCLFDTLDRIDESAAMPIGHCSEFEQTFGCFAQLPDELDLPVIPSYEPPQICVY